MKNSNPVSSADSPQNPNITQHHQVPVGVPSALRMKCMVQELELQMGTYLQQKSRQTTGEDTLAPVLMDWGSRCLCHCVCMELTLPKREVKKRFINLALGRQTVLCSDLGLFVLRITPECLSLKAAHQNYLDVLSCKITGFASPLLEVLFGNIHHILSSGNQCDLLTAVLKLSTYSIFHEY